jgi:8-oxo-dGTP pyrophosphatase MutT (NUDIX family)
VSKSRHNGNKSQNQKKQPKTDSRQKSPNAENIGRKFKNIRRRIRRAVSEETAGGVVFRRGEDGIEILMIQDPKDRWSVPKGKIEKGEKVPDAARREVTEETGLKHLKVLDYLGKVNFRFRSQDMLVSKTLHLYMIHAHKDSDSYQPEKHEGIKDVAWFSVNDALDSIEYDDIGKLFLLALKNIRHAGY